VIAYWINASPALRDPRRASPVDNSDGARCPRPSLPRVPPRRVLTFAALALLAVTLAGCAQPSVEAHPSPSPTPMFATDAEALAAATKAYARYLMQEVLKDGGRNADRLRTVATGKQLAAELRGLRKAEANDWRGIGSVSFSSVSELVVLDGGRKVEMQLCEDDSLLSIVDATGVSVISASREPRTLYRVLLAQSTTRRDVLLIGLREPATQTQC
jgi:hypothetical protein